MKVSKTNKSSVVVDLSNMVIICKDNWHLASGASYNLDNTTIVAAPKPWRMWLIMKLLIWHPVHELKRKVSELSNHED